MVIYQILPMEDYLCLTRVFMLVQSISMDVDLTSIHYSHW